MTTQSWAAQLAQVGALTGALLWSRPPRRGALRDGAGAGQFKHDDWNALVRRFVQAGKVDYVNFTRVRRILEAYLERIADARPETWPDADDQLALYINAYNAIVVHQIVVAGAVASFRDVPLAMTRPYPVGRENLSLLQLEHSKLRAFGDPRVHSAIVGGARSAPGLQSFAYTGQQLQSQLDQATRQFFADEVRGARYEAASNTLYLSPIVRRYAGDWANPAAMPNMRMLAYGQLQPRIALPFLTPWLPPAVQAALNRSPAEQPHLAFLDYDWSLNGTTGAVREQAIGRG